MAANQGVEIRDGDIILVRTGWPNATGLFDSVGEWAAGAPGLSWKCAEWFHDHSISAVASDNLAVEVRRMELENVALPLHLLAIRDMGMHLGELWHFEALATDCQEDRVFEVLLIAPPLPITGGVGSPLNPLAIK